MQQYTESRYIKSLTCANMHSSSNRMHEHVTMCDYVFHRYQTGFIVCHMHLYKLASAMCKYTVYLSVCEYAIMMMYRSIYECNNAIVCRSVSQHEHMHVHV